MSKTLFVTRHAGAADWARRRGFGAVAVDHLEIATVEPGDTVLGTLPVHLAADVCARGAGYFHLEMDVPAARRGTELTPDDMDQFGAALVPYRVERL